MMALPWLIPSFILKFAVLFPGFSSAVLVAHVHPDAGISCELGGEFDSPEACWAAMHWLDWYGVEDVVICRIHRLEAPLSGYLVDALGRWEIGENTYTLVRIGVRDAQEGRSHAGMDFTLLAVSFTENGAVWLPNRDTEVFLPDHEFLTDEAQFLAIPEDFPL